MGSPKSGSRLGTRFGPYQLQSVIGVGGMGEVYRAYDTTRERMVAIKLLRPEMAADHSFQQRFRRFLDSIVPLIRLEILPKRQPMHAPAPQSQQQ